MNRESKRIQVDFLDTTLRDGAQALPKEHQFEDGAKPAIAHEIAQFGVQVIEAGFPATPDDAVRVKQVADTVGRRFYLTDEWQDGRGAGEVRRQPVIAGLARANKDDIERTWEAVRGAERPRIHTFISTDDAHMKAKFPGKTPAQILEQAVQAVACAKEVSAGSETASVEFSAEAASTTDSQYLEEVVKAVVNAGADVINVPDTVGQRSPFFMRGFYADVIRWVLAENPEVRISAHTHNDLGAAAMNSLALVYAADDVLQGHEGVDHIALQIGGTVAGLGERAGNADLFSVVASLFKFSPEVEASVIWKTNPNRAVETASQVMRAAGSMPLPPRTPVVGEDILAHRSGIHSDGVIKGGYEIYTPHDPRFWGHAVAARHEDGAYQGRAGKSLIQEHRA